MKTMVFDLEADELYEKATRVWCASTIVVESSERKNYTYHDNGINSFLDYMRSMDVVVGHNIIEYDFRLLKKLYDFTYTGKVIDTLVLSRYLFPERPGGHGIEAWGKRVNRFKPSHDDWSQFTPDMMHRCAEDTEINQLVLGILYEELKQRKQTIEGVQLW